jgi:hypothetical protein
LCACGDINALCYYDQFPGGNRNAHPNEHPDSDPLANPYAATIAGYIPIYFVVSR